MHFQTMKKEIAPSELIKSAMEALGMNQPRFAEAVGVDQATVSKWVNGKVTPSGPVLRLIERMVPSEDFVKEPDTSQQEQGA